MNIPSFPSDDTYARLFRARTPRPFTDLFSYYYSLLGRASVDVTTDDSGNGMVLMVTRNGIDRKDTGFVDFGGNHRRVDWNPPHSLVWLDEDVVGLTRSLKGHLLRFDARKMKWLDPIDLQLTHHRIIGAAQWLGRDPWHVYIYYHNFYTIGYIRMHRITHKIENCGEWPDPGGGAKFELCTMDFQRVLFYKPFTQPHLAFGWTMGGGKMNAGLCINCIAHYMAIDYVEGDTVKINVPERRTSMRVTTETMDIYYDTRTMKTLRIETQVRVEN